MTTSSLFTQVRLTLLMLAWISTQAWSGPYDDALAARSRGDFAAAFGTFRQLATSGDAKAQFQLSLLYASGKGVAADSTQALHWLRQAASRGHVPAQSNLGVAFNMGRLVPQDRIKAYAWSAIAALGGDGVASTNRDVIARKLNAAQLEQARALAQSCLTGNFAPCL